MSSQILNEGRVVGLSAYEEFLRRFYSAEGEEAVPPTEQEWLASSLASGASLLLKVPQVTAGGATYPYAISSIALPEGSTLAACNTIVASFFLGEAHLMDNWWADRVTSYGELLDVSETSGHRDTDDTTSIPFHLSALDREKYRAQLGAYSRIVDGVVIQPGTWFENTSQVDLLPDLSPEDTTRPVVRLMIKGNIAQDERPYVLLTGFTDKRVVATLANTESGSTDPDTYNASNGDYLGPNTFPWGSKIVFTTPTYYLTELSTVEEIPDISLQYAYDRNPTYSAIGNTASISLKPGTESSLYAMSENPEADPIKMNDSHQLTWQAMLQALSNNRGLDLFSNDSGDVFKPGFGINIVRNTHDGAFTIFNSAPDMNAEGTAWIDVSSPTINSSGNYVNHAIWTWGPFIPNTEGSVLCKPNTKIAPQTPTELGGGSQFCMMLAELSYTDVATVNSKCKTMYSGDVATWSPRIQVLPRWKNTADFSSALTPNDLAGFYLRISSNRSMTLGGALHKYTIGNGCLAAASLNSTPQIGWTNSLNLVHGNDPTYVVNGQDNSAVMQMWMGVLEGFADEVRVDPNTGKSFNLSWLNQFLTYDANHPISYSGATSASIWNIDFLKSTSAPGTVTSSFDFDDASSSLIREGGHWPVYCSMTPVPYRTPGNTSIRGLALIAYSIGDGINQSISVLARNCTSVSSTDRAKAVIVGGANVTIAGYVTKR